MASEHEPLYRTWLTSDGTVSSRFVRPLIQFTHVEAAGGIVLLVAAAIAMIWANSPWGDTYAEFWESHLSFHVGPIHFDESLKHVVNDGLMVIFFFVVGLEIKRELVVGELADPRRAALPALAALGGMIAPALIFLAFVSGTGGEATQGWGIPMATDIAFSVGVISLLGSRVSVSAKLFLLALAIADDIGAIAVIAVFYTDELSTVWLAEAIVLVGAVYLAQRVNVRSILFYVIIGLFVWYFVFESGVHATLAGVALGLMTPAVAYISDQDFRQRARWILDRFDMDAASPRARERIDADALELSVIAKESVSPLDRLERALHPWSSFVVVPLFALANAGVRFADIDVAETITSSVSLGIAVGLVVGKTVGITVFTWLAVRFGLGVLPRKTTWRDIIGLGALAGIGFTVSLFIAELAFSDEALTDAAKLGIFVGSILAGVIGFMILRSSPTPAEELEASRAAMGLDAYEYEEDAVDAAEGSVAAGE